MAFGEGWDQGDQEGKKEARARAVGQQKREMGTCQPTCTVHTSHRQAYLSLAM